MPVGLQTFDRNGNLIIDLTTRMARFLGRVSGVQSNGSQLDDQLTTGTPFAMVLPMSLEPSEKRTFTVPAVTFSGNTMTWSYDTQPWAGTSQPQDRVPSDIIYGVIA